MAWWCVMLGLGLVAALASLRAQRRPWRGRAEAGGFSWQASLPWSPSGRVVIGLPAAGLPRFDCMPRAARMEAWRRMGMLGELRVGDETFERAFFLLSDDPRVRAVLRQRGGIRQSLIDLAFTIPPGARLHRISCDDGSLRVEYRSRSRDVAPFARRALPHLAALRAQWPPLEPTARPADDGGLRRLRGLRALITGLLVAGAFGVARHALLGDQALVLEPSELLRVGLMVAFLLFLLVGAGTWWLLAGSAWFLEGLRAWLLRGSVATLLLGTPLVHDLNMLVGSRLIAVESGEVTSLVMHASSKHDRGVDYSARFRGLPSLPGPTDLDWVQYRRLAVGDRVEIWVFEGGFGIRYIDALRVLPR